MTVGFYHTLGVYCSRGRGLSTIHTTLEIHRQTFLHLKIQTAGSTNTVEHFPFPYPPNFQAHREFYSTLYQRLNNSHSPSCFGYRKRNNVLHSLDPSHKNSYLFCKIHLGKCEGSCSRSVGKNDKQV